jgi:DNA-binding NarL/FixJ family response regulator
MVFLTVHTDPDVIHAALETGALGYVVKASLNTDLLFAMREAYQGRTFVSLETSAQ